ncbi:hypothetical protein WA026_016996 [Henosepilachna vigintioctopunctata]|uniref:Uncharacterized protein n=1 Tax=Henosepilachna vigintioctopunctata TaxID=420089 RepID=A0AAW1U3V6_9CUCU
MLPECAVSKSMTEQVPALPDIPFVAEGRRGIAVSVSPRTARKVIEMFCYVDNFSKSAVHCRWDNSLTEITAQCGKRGLETLFEIASDYSVLLSADAALSECFQYRLRQKSFVCCFLFRT